MQHLFKCIHFWHAFKALQGFLQEALDLEHVSVNQTSQASQCVHGASFISVDRSLLVSSASFDFSTFSPS